MRAFTCQNCRQLVFFENSECLRRHSALGFVPARRSIVAFHETFAHYPHIRDTLQTAAAFGVSVTGPRVSTIQDRSLAVTPTEELLDERFGQVVADWLARTYALNAVNRSMGKEDLYPFVLSPSVIDKLSFVHERVNAAARAGAAAAA